MSILCTGSMRIEADKRAWDSRGGRTRWLAYVVCGLMCASTAAGGPSLQEPAPTEPPPADPIPEPDPAAPESPTPEATKPLEEGAAPIGPVSPGADAGERAAADSEPALPPPFVAAYRDLDGTAAELERWSSALPKTVRRLDLGVTRDGRRVPAIEFGLPGPVALEDRPTAFLLGGLDGSSLSGGEAVLACVDALLRESADLPPDLTFVALPWASPEALEMHHAGLATDGRNGRPLDEDHDGRIDEDGPDDLDGDGAVMQMLIEDPHGPWVRCADGRFLVPAGPGDAPRYVMTMEGRDDDGDGAFNEDGPGGVVLDINFPLGRFGPWTGELNGPLPMSEPLTRALAELVLARRTALVLLFQGNHGGIAAPGGVERPDGTALLEELDNPIYQRATALFAASTGREQRRVLPLYEPRGKNRRGAALDWFYAVPGALSLEVAAWGPMIEGGTDVAARDARFRTESGSAGLPDVGVLDRVWSLWLDNTRGGLGFVDWHPVDLPNGRQALVGGWEPHTRLNPPPEMLAHSLLGLPEFVRELTASRPRLEIITQSERNGEVCRVSARVRNAGLLPTRLAVSEERPGPNQLTLEMSLPPGSRLLAGELVCRLPRLLGSDLSDACEWIVLAPPGSAFTLTAKSHWTLPVVREVKP